MGKLSAKQIAKARKLSNEGHSFRALGKKFGVSDQTVRRAVDPVYAVKRRARERAYHKEAYKTETDGCNKVRRDLNEDWARLMAETPADTRDLTARLLGDPLPGRSALDQKTMADEGTV